MERPTISPSSAIGSNTHFGDGSDDRIEVQGSSNNLVYAEVGVDTVLITGSGANTVFGGTGAGDPLFNQGDGNNVVFAGSSDNDPLDGADLLRIKGNGANLLVAKRNDDTIVIVGIGPIVLKKALLLPR